MFAMGADVAVHPHSRGEHLVSASAMRASNGSSPLARGTHDSRRGRRRDDRFIPTRAGNTTANSSSHRLPTVHPHSRGEHASTCCRIFSRVRFIPTRAGNTRVDEIQQEPQPVHPHSRGEHDWRGGQKSNVYGSSPLARGTHQRQSIHRAGFRFIPTRAGNTPAGCAAPAVAPVHPHSRGEHSASVATMRFMTGSSPLARGTRASTAMPPASIPVHPHSRGEHRVTMTTRQRQMRFIPTRAGNTFPPLSVIVTRAVHPHSRGEHAFKSGEKFPSPGSSPLARGTHFFHHIDLPGKFIALKIYQLPLSRNARYEGYAF